MDSNEFDKEKMLFNSRAFCMLPWVTVHKNPDGKTTACCIAKSDEDIDTISSIDKMVNTDLLKKVRRDMLQDKLSYHCSPCYYTERSGLSTSARKSYNERYAHYFDEVIASTGTKGKIHDFKMRFYDIRFSNICNFKCRTCGAGYSSQWEIEDRKHKNIIARSNKVDLNSLVNEICDQIPNINHAYFAGGEPLVTEEHYIILEEMIRQGRTDIELTYNTNISKLNFKNYDLLDLWNRFEGQIQVYASIDHYGKKAEYIRHGTNWQEVKSNYKKLKNSEKVHLNITTTVSALNYVTLGDLFVYFYRNNMWPDSYWQINYALDPAYMNAYMLPDTLKYKGRRNIRDSIRFLEDKGVKKSQLNEMERLADSVFNQQNWKNYRKDFQVEMKRLDNIRGENFLETLPELGVMME